MSSTPIPGEAIAPKYSAFNIIDTAYKHVRETPIFTSILVPKDVKPGRAPVAVHWHGGGLILGHRLFPDWHAKWTLDLAARQGAIVVSPDHRLLPEAKVEDIMEDTSDLYAWLFAENNLKEQLPKGVEPDLKHILVTGESAGGYLAVQAGFQIPGKISAIVSQYPMLDMKAPHFTEAYHKDLLDPSVPQLSVSILDDHLKALKGVEVVTSRVDAASMPLMLVSLQAGRYGSMFGSEPKLHPFDMLERADSFPPLWLVHGSADNVVPVEGTKKFVEAFQKQLPCSPLVVTIREGEAHGFDDAEKATGLPAELTTGWVVEGVKFVDQYWS